MDKFEEIGRDISEAVARLTKFVEEEVAPETEKRTATFLREASEKLSQAAGWLEKRREARTDGSAKGGS